MGSRFFGVPLSATQIAPKVVPLYKNNNDDNASTGIRAPITVDDSDFEYSGSSKSRENSTTSSYYSGSDIESEGSRSVDDDELERVVERPYAADEKTLFVGEYAFPRPSSESNELAQESSSSSNSNKRGFSRPSVVEYGERFGQVSGRINRNAIFRPFVRTQDNISDEGAGGNSGLYLSESDELIEEDDNVPKYKKFRSAVPIALISRDSDDDSRSLGSEFSDDDGFLGGTVRVPKVRISELDVFPDNEALAKNGSEMEFVEGKNNRVEGSNLLAVSSATILDEVSDAESRVDSHFAGEVHMLLSEPEQTDIAMHSDDEIREFDPLFVSKDLFEGVLPGNISFVPSTEEMGIICEIVGLEKRDVTELDHNSDFREAAPCSDDNSRSLGSEFSDDDGFLGGVVRVPKVRISKLDVVADNLSFAMNGTEMEFVECLVIDDAIMSSNGEIVRDNNRVEGSNLRALSSAPIQDEVSDAESRVDSHFVGEVHMLMSEPEKNEFAVHSDKEVQEFDPLVLSKDLSESGLPGNISSASSSEKMGFECEFVELEELVVTELDHSSDFREATPCNDDDLESDKNIEKEILETDNEQESLAFSYEEILQDRTQEIDGPIISNSETTIPMIQAKSNNEFTGTDELDVTLSEGEQKLLKKIQQVRVKYLRLLRRLGFSDRDPVATHVLHQLNVAEAKFSSRVFDLHSAEEESMKFESYSDEDSDSSLNILVIGKTGVGKSATINSIFDETKTSVNAFQPTTTDVKEIDGIIHGVRVKVFDTPGLRIDQSINQKVLTSIEKTVKKRLIDVVLYVDRLDSNISSLNDLPMFKSIASYLGSSMWSKSILVLTHASSLPPDGSEGAPLSYETLVSEWSRAVQQLISRSCGEMNPNSMALVSAVENNPFSENKSADATSLGGKRWRLNLLLLCYSMKTLSEVHSTSSINHGDLPSLSFLQSNAYHKLSKDPTTDNVYSDMEAHLSLSYQEKDDECDYISSCKPLIRSQIAKTGQRLGDPSKTASRTEIFKAETLAREIGRDDDVAVFLQDKELPPSFRYRFSEPSPQILARPVLSSHGWDHDRSYDGVLVEYEVDITDHVLKAQTTFRNFKKNKTDAGMPFTYPIDESRTSLGLSFMRHRGGIIYGCNLESRIPLSRRNSKLCIRAGLNSKRSGRISIKTSCSDQLNLGAIALLPIASAIFKKMFFPSNENLL